MRHRKKGVKLGRTSSHRKAMFRNMVTSLLRHEAIVTTEPKAKALRGYVEPLITLARTGGLHSLRLSAHPGERPSATHSLIALRLSGWRVWTEAFPV